MKYVVIGAGPTGVIVARPDEADLHVTRLVAVEISTG